MAKSESDTLSLLFPPQEAVIASTSEINASPHSVTSLTKAIRDTLESKFIDITVEGEISNLTNHRSGHRYWTLKDEGAQISCVFWKSRITSFAIENGQKVLCRGRLTVYPPKGNYQFDIYQIRPLGIGALQAAFEALYKKLLNEGLFDESRKRPIPKFPKKIGVVTSPTGAALHDILTVLRRRYPIAEVLFRPASVQGIGAELEIAQAIREINFLPKEDQPDVLIVGRGGGSLEDLWAFNEEAVARAIFSSRIPVISAVGHEVDITIADFASDLRAPTPTAAAELATPDKNELLSSLYSSVTAMEYLVNRRMEGLQDAFSQIYPLSLIRPMGPIGRIFSEKRHIIRSSSGKMESKISHFLELAESRTHRFESSLRALNPYSVLDRGYAIVQDSGGQVIGKATQMTSNEAEILFSDGKISVRRTA